ncbi:MAG: hypothetical protein NC218_01860 [Acetobacter sp.]|nr:hypothetical protein [Acetobacter sp.]
MKESKVMLIGVDVKQNLIKLIADNEILNDNLRQAARDAISYIEIIERDNDNLLQEILRVVTADDAKTVDKSEGFGKLIKTEMLPVVGVWRDGNIRYKNIVLQCQNTILRFELDINKQSDAYFITSHAPNLYWGDEITRVTLFDYENNSIELCKEYNPMFNQTRVMCIIIEFKSGEQLSFDVQRDVLQDADYAAVRVLKDGVPIRL